MAKIPAPRKEFNFRVEMLGFDQFECQEFELPDVEVDQTHHGDTNHDIKTAGRVKVGNMKMKKLRPLPLPDNFFNIWMGSCQSMLLGGGVLPLTYKQIMVVKEMDTTGLVPINQWICEGVWPCKIAGLKFNRMSSDNTIMELEFSVDRCYPIGVQG